MYDTNSIKTNNPLLDVVEKHLGQPIKRGRHINFFRCPFHDDSDPSMAVYDNENFYCYGCGAHGDVIDYVMRANNVSFLEACTRLGGGELDPIEAEAAAQQRKEREHERLIEQQERYQQALQDLQDAQAYRRYMENQTDESRRLWTEQGIPPVWQSFFRLGYAPDFWGGPSLTIPIFEPVTGHNKIVETPKLLNIRHRLIGAKDGNKYRPESPGLGQQLFVADWELPLSGKVVLVEGEKKAMITFFTADDPSLQVVGIPGKRVNESILDQLTDCERIYMIPDPDGVNEFKEMAHYIGTHKCRLIELPDKIDDLIIRNRLDSKWMIQRMRQAVKL